LEEKQTTDAADAPPDSIRIATERPAELSLCYEADLGHTHVGPCGGDADFKGGVPVAIGRVTSLVGPRRWEWAALVLPRLRQGAV